MALEALLLCESLLQQNTVIDWSVAAAAVQNSALVTRVTPYSPDVLSAAFPASLRLQFTSASHLCAALTTLPLLFGKSMKCPWQELLAGFLKLSADNNLRYDLVY